MKILREKSLTVSEVAYKVGFSSPIYFSKCFHEYFGYPPGKVGQREGEINSGYPVQSHNKRLTAILVSSALLVVLAVVLIVLIKPSSTKQNNLEKSIVVLFPINNSGDSKHLHQINGTVDAILNNLSLISDLTVYPMSSVLKYRDSDKSGVEIAKELNASYVVETSGIAYGNNIRLNIKLINAIEGTQVWYNPYDVDAKDIIKLPLEIAGKIASEIHAEITPEEKQRIETKPTQNTEAWNNYLKGRDLYNKGLNQYYGSGEVGNRGIDNIQGIDNFEEAVKDFKKALEHDNKFALAYAQLAITYFLMDIGNENGIYSMEININADKAILNDSHHDMCLIAKALNYINEGENKLAIPFLEKAIQYNPKSVVSYRMLADIYNLSREANTEKYLEYNILAVKLGIIGEDDIQKSEDYRLAARAFRVAGFYNEAEEYIEKSIGLNPSNYSSIGEKGEIIIERDNNYLKVREILLDAFSRDSSNIEIMRFLHTNHYLTRDYQGAYEYYKKIFEADKKLSFLVGRDYSRLAVICDKLDMPKEYEICFNQFKESERLKLNSYLNSIGMTRLYSLENNKEKALEQLNRLNQQKYHFSFTIRMLKDDSVFDNIRNLPEFQKIISEMESKFRANHERIRVNLKEKRLL